MLRQAFITMICAGTAFGGERSLLDAGQGTPVGDDQSLLGGGLGGVSVDHAEPDRAEPETRTTAPVAESESGRIGTTLLSGESAWAAPKLRYEVAPGWRLEGHGVSRVFDSDYKYFAITAETRFDLTDNTGFVLGYDLYRVARPGSLEDLNLGRDGVFAELKIDF